MASNILDHKRYGEGFWMDSRTWWKDADVFALEVLCEADSNIEQSADALGRPPKSLAWKARDSGFILPSPWARLIAPKRAIKLRTRDPILAYPYITKPRPEHADLLEINSIIPKSIPDNMRADMCQEIMLAILEGRTTLDDLRSRSKNSAYFIRKFYHDNFEQAGQALSFSAVTAEGDQDERSYDEIASSIAAKDWHHEQFADRTRYGDILKTFTAPDQIEAVWRDQVGRHRIKLSELGQFLSFEEVAEMLSENHHSDDDRTAANPTDGPS